MSTKYGVAAVVVVTGIAVGLAAARIYGMVRMARTLEKASDKVVENVTDILRESNGLPPRYLREVRGEVIETRKVNGVYRNDAG